MTKWHRGKSIPCFGEPSQTPLPIKEDDRCSPLGIIERGYLITPAVLFSTVPRTLGIAHPVFLFDFPQPQCFCYFLPTVQCRRNLYRLLQHGKVLANSSDGWVVGAIIRNSSLRVSRKRQINS